MANDEQQIRQLMDEWGGGGARREGHVLSIFRKSPSGQWVLARDANFVGAGKQGDDRK